MIEHQIEFDLPSPWQGVKFSTNYIGEINFLVGPNGSGKSRFSEVLKDNLPNSRLLGTDRLRGMNKNESLGFLGENFGRGYEKARFEQIINAGTKYGSGLDTFVILEERPDIRIIIEATLSTLFGREISLEWDSGYLVPKATQKSTQISYRLDRDECHGIKELLVLLTHLYNDQYEFLIIDEPELNLHPQFQAFFMKEAQQVASKLRSGTSKKTLFLITHSPFIVDIRSWDDLKSVMCFDLQFSEPRRVPQDIDGTKSQLSHLIPRINSHHKQLFFSDNPIFVEGVLDLQIIKAIQEARNVSITAAGSCLIEVGGREELNRYVQLCTALGKEAYFFYDLDSLFSGKMRQCVNEEYEISEFGAALGLGDDFVRYCGGLDRVLTEAIKIIRNCEIDELSELREYLNGLLKNGKNDTQKLGKARVAVLVKLNQCEDAFSQVLSGQHTTDIKGRLDQITNMLRKLRIVLLPGGALEHYLPSFNGNIFNLSEKSKRNAVQEELDLLASDTNINLEERYGDLLRSISYLPAKPEVDTNVFIEKYLSMYIFKTQTLILDYPDWTEEMINKYLTHQDASKLGRIFTVQDLHRHDQDRKEFSANILVRLPTIKRSVKIDHKTNAGMRDYSIASNPKTRES